MYNQECRREAKELDDYQDACCTIFTQLLALLPEAAVDTIKACAEWANIYATKDVPGLRNAPMQAVLNTNNRLYTALQAARSTRATFTLKQRKSESAHNFYERCMAAFQAHSKAGHGWPIETHYKKAIATLAHPPDHDRSNWTNGEPPAEEGKTLDDDCVEALKAIIFLNGLTDQYKEYNDHLANAFAESNDICPKRTLTAKERIARHKPSAAAPTPTPYYVCGLNGPLP